MFTIPKGSPVTKKVIEAAIEENEKRVPTYNKLEEYYDGEHAILSRVKEDRFKNNQIVVNHAEYISDLKVSHLIGNPVTYGFLDDKKNLNMDRIMDAYREQTISRLDHEIAETTSQLGKCFDREYLDGNDVRTAKIDPRNCIMIYDDSVKHEKVAAILYDMRVEKEGTNDTFNEVKVIDNEYVYDWLSRKKTIADGPVDEDEHKFKVIPVTEYINNKKGTGDYEKVITLIDAYNTIVSDRVNDKEQLVEAILAIKGMGFPDEMASSLKKNRIIADIPADGGVDFLTKELNEDQLHILKKDIEDDLHKISKTPNMTDSEFIGNSSGVALAYKLLPFEMDTANKEKYFEESLKERFSIYNDYYRRLKGMNEIPTYEIDVVFTRRLPQNDLETSQMINNLDGKVPSEKLIGQLSFIDNAKEAVEQALKEWLKKFGSGVLGFGTEEPNSIDNLEEKGNEKVSEKSNSLLDKINQIINGK